MNRAFVIADLHLKHEKVIEFEQEHRPFSTIEEHDEELIYRFNSVVKKRDTAWILGDLIFKKSGFELIARLNGIKRLVIGNHDLYPSGEYLKYFNKLYSCAEYEGCLLTHIPIHPSQFRRYRLNIHGHLHHNVIDDPRYVCVSAEQVNLTPVLLSDLISERLKLI